jgi:uncharacterized protein YjbI with pentapeptide repeats
MFEGKWPFRWTAAQPAMPQRDFIATIGHNGLVRWLRRWPARRAARPAAVPDAPLRVMPGWWAIVAAAVVLVGGLLAMWLLLGVWSPASPDADRSRLERVKIGLTVMAGLAAGVTLLVTLRRQRMSERAQRFAETDALEQRTTALYVAAAAQLGSDKAAVRLAGLYALERLGQDNRKLRQTVVDVWCAYLRMPYTPPAEILGGAGALPGPRAAPDDGPALSGTAPGGTAPGGTAPGGAAPDEAVDAERRQELQVRRTAQRLLAAHVSRPPGEAGEGAYWLDARGDRLVIDLAGAVLVDFALVAGDVGRCDLSRVNFHGPADLSGANFHGGAALSEARFHGTADLGRVRFHDAADLGRARFHGRAELRGARFHGRASLAGARFHAMADLREVEFETDAALREARFDAVANLRGAAVRGAADLGQVQFLGNADLSDMHFHGDASLEGAQFDRNAFLTGTWFHGKARLSGTHFQGRSTLDEARFDHGVDLTGATARQAVALPGGWVLSGVEAGATTRREIVRDVAAGEHSDVP